LNEKTKGDGMRLKNTKELMKMIDDRDKKIQHLEWKIDDLKDFAIWMTGCGYDFCQHEYFVKQRDKLLKEH